jgi:hypothetical protein
LTTLDETIAHTLASLSADEIVAALGLERAPAPLRAIVRAASFQVSRPLGRLLARFDARIGERGIAAAAAAAIADLEARFRVVGPPPPRTGPLLVVSNHPGAYDTLTLLAALGRDDAAIVAADRRFLRAMPTFARKLCFVADTDGAPTLHRSSGLRHALRHLRAGGAIVQFGAGRIEPDPAFPSREPLLATWLPGTGVLARGAAAAGGRVVATLLEGVISPKARRVLLVRLAERRGVTTIAPLLQIALRRYHDVSATVRFGSAIDAADAAGVGDDAAIAAWLRGRALALR